MPTLERCFFSVLSEVRYKNYLALNEMRGRCMVTKGGNETSYIAAYFKISPLARELYIHFN